MLSCDEYEAEDCEADDLDEGKEIDNEGKVVPSFANDDAVVNLDDGLG